MSKLRDEKFIKEHGGFASPNDIMINPEYGGMFGFSPNIGGVDPTDGVYASWVSNQAHVDRNLIAIVLEYPKIWDYMNNGMSWIKTFKAMIELHAKTITGLNKTLTVVHGEHALGGGGEQQEEVVNVTRERSQINSTHIDKLGKPFQKLLEGWIRYCIMDPDTKVPLVASLDRMEGELVKHLDMDLYTADLSTATILFMETDLMRKHVEECYISTNFMPKSTGEWVSKKDITADGEVSELSIDWTSITINNVFTKIIGQQLLSSMSVFSTLPYMSTAFIDPEKPRDSKLSEEVTPHGFNMNVSS